MVTGPAQFRRYQRSWLRGDLLAGVTVAAYLIPQVMAYAGVAGLPPATGLWAVVGPLLIYSFLGSSRQLSVGPESTTALMTAATLAPLASGDPARYAALATALALIVGGICLLGRFVRLGLLADLLSRPVLVGYMAGIAIIMITSQLGKLTGVPVHGDEFVGQVGSFVRGLHGIHLPTLVLSVSTLLVLELLARGAPRWPGPLIGILAVSAIVALFSLQNNGIQLTGAVPKGLPMPGLPDVSAADVAVLLVPAVGIAFVGFSDNMLTARAFAARTGDRVDADAELSALGANNLASGLMHGFPVSCSGSRTAIAVLLGCRTQLYSIVALGIVLVILFAGGALLELFPTAALGALVMFAAMRLIDIAEFTRIARFRRSELVLAVSTTVAVLGLGVLYGVLAAVTISVLDLLRRVARAHDAILGFVPGVAGMHDIDDYPNANPVPGLVVYRYDAPLCFANAEDFRSRALAAVESAGGTVRWFVLNAEANVEVDLTALDALDQLRIELNRRGIVFVVAQVKHELAEAFRAAGLTDKIGDGRIFLTLASAVTAYRTGT